MGVMGKNGITVDTPANILFGAGTYYKNLTWDNEKAEWTGTCIGATNGGGKLTIEGEYIDLEVDGALVLFKGQTVKAGGKASMEVSLAEISNKNFALFANFEQGVLDVDDNKGLFYGLTVDKPNIEDGDYIENLAFVGKTAHGAKDIIVLFKYALCKSAFELEAKNKSQSGLKAVFEAYADLTLNPQANCDYNFDTLPVEIYYPPDVIN